MANSYPAGVQTQGTLTGAEFVDIDAGGAVSERSTTSAIANTATALSGTTISGATINGGTVSGATVSGGTISGGTISAAALTGATTIASGAVITSPVVSGGAASTVIHGYAAQLQVPISAVSAAGTPTTLNVPQGAVITSLIFGTTTSFTGTTVSAAVGSASGDASYVAATSIKAGGYVTLSPVASIAAAAALLSAPASGSLVFTLEQGTPTATGSGTLLVNYVVP